MPVAIESELCAESKDSSGDVATAFDAIESELCVERLRLRASLTAAQDRIAELERNVKPGATLIYDRSQAQGYSLEPRLVCCQMLEHGLAGDNQTSVVRSILSLFGIVG